MKKGHGISNQSFKAGWRGQEEGNVPDTWNHEPYESSGSQDPRHVAIVVEMVFLEEVIPHEVITSCAAV